MVVDTNTFLKNLLKMSNRERENTARVATDNSKASNFGMRGLKSCPRCKGAIIIDRDLHGWYESCLQCGYQRELPEVDDAQLPTKSKKDISKMTKKREPKMRVGV